MDAIITVDKRQHIVVFNAAAERIFRCKAADAVGSPLDRFIPERFRTAHRAHVERFASTGATGRRMGSDMVLYGLRADGEEFPIEASISHARYGGKELFTVVLRDVSARVKAVSELEHSHNQLQELYRQMHEVREAERVRIARELHDELAQWLTALKMDASWLAGRVAPEDDKVREKFERMKGLVDSTVASVRRLAHDLRPAMLDDLGLVAAVEHLLHEFSQRSGIVVGLDTGTGEIDFREPLATAVYRMVQEALTNVARHARATEVRVAMRVDGQPADRVGMGQRHRDQRRAAAERKVARHPRHQGARPHARGRGGCLQPGGRRHRGGDQDPGAAVWWHGGAGVIRVLLADDHAIVRAGLKEILADTGDIEVAAEATNGQDVMAQIRARDFDVAVLDMSMPGRSGIELIKQVKDEKPKLRILILTMHSEQQYAVRALKAGASGFLTKEAAADQLVAAIRKIAGGGAYISPETAERLVLDAAPRAESAPHTLLSDREFQVLQMIAGGKTVGEIAKRLSLSVKTVSTHKTRILHKMGLANQAELIRYALEHKLLDESGRSSA